MILDLVGDSYLPNRLLVHAGQHGDAEQQDVSRLCRNSGPNHRFAAGQMDRQHLYFKLSGRFDGKGNCVGYVVQLKIEKNIRARCTNGSDDLWTFRGVKLQADFEKRDLVAQFL